jgi:hypothetical protein
MRLVFVTPNSWNADEAQRLLAGLDVEFSRLALPRGDATSLDEVVRARAEAAWSALQRPCFVENAELVQVDFGWGERLAVPPVDTLVRGRTWRAVTPEVMFGWKVHSLVEHGPRGRWHAKTMADLYLMLQHVRLEQTRCRACIAAAFESQRMSPSALDGFLDDPTWGQSRGSRNKWKSYVKKSPWVTFTLAEAFPVVRDAVKHLVRG